MIRDSFINLVTLFLVFSGMLLKAAALVAITMAVLWLIGAFFPVVADSLGLPQQKIYELFEDIFDGLDSLKEDLVGGTETGARPKNTPLAATRFSVQTADRCQKTPKVVANLNANVRAGPGMHFDIITHLMKQESAEVIARNPDASW